jgi:hypothetical protein
METVRSSETPMNFYKLQDVTFQKTVLLIITAMRIYNSIDTYKANKKFVPVLK